MKKSHKSLYRINLTGLITNDGTTPPAAGSSNTNLYKHDLFHHVNSLVKTYILT